MYRLFSRVPKGLDPVAESFRKHVESEGLALVKEVTEAAAQKKDEKGKPFQYTQIRCFLRLQCLFSVLNCASHIVQLSLDHHTLQK